LLESRRHAADSEDVRRFVSLLAVGGALACVVGAGSARTSPSLTLYVSTAGSDSSAGRTAAAPLRTIQAALDRARPGTTIRVAAGTYAETLHTVRDGTASAPIVVLGPGGAHDAVGRLRAVVRGQGRVLSVDHSHYRFAGFTIDGEPGLARAAFPSTLGATEAFKESVRSRAVDSRLIYVGAADTVRGVHDVTVTNMTLRHAGGECVHIRNDSTRVTVSGSLIAWCGLYAKTGDGTYAYHNGEGVYIGTSPKSSDAPLAGSDHTAHVLVRGNVIRTYGAECVDVKEGASDNTVAGNVCADDAEPLGFGGSLIELRGSDNHVVGNRLSGSRGYGIKIASDDPTRYPIDGNTIHGNTSVSLAGAPLQSAVLLAATAVCGNSYVGGGDYSTLTAEFAAACS
jgi:hypothetical protein